jgi:hypothetical protein
MFLKPPPAASQRATAAPRSHRARHRPDRAGPAGAVRPVFRHRALDRLDLEQLRDLRPRLRDPADQPVADLAPPRELQPYPPQPVLAGPGLLAPCSAPAGWRPSWARCRWCRNTPSSPCSRLIALALLGPRLAGSLAFPLLFLLFAVPFGEIFVAPLIQFTADFTVGRCAPPASRCCAAAPASSCRPGTGRWSKPAAACAT